MHTKRRQEKTCERLNSVLGESCLTCELVLSPPEYVDSQLGCSFISSSIPEELFSSQLSEKEVHSQALSPELVKLKKSNINIDNSLSPAHTLLQIHCPDQRGLLYDTMRTFKDYRLQVRT